MKYSKSDGAYFRKSKKENSIKGGKLRENGILENRDFSGKNGNNVVPKQKFKVEQNSNMGVELQNMNPNNVGKYKPTNSVKPIKIMKQIFTDEPYIFFGYNPETDTYNLVCYNNPKANHGIEFKKLVIHENDSSEIVTLSHTDFLDIGIEELIVLCYHFLKIRKQNHGFMDTLYKYLSDFVFQKVLRTRFPPSSNNHKMYKDMVEEIEKMVMEEGHRIFNQQHGGKLDRDGKLDSQDFNLERNIYPSVEIEMNSYYENVSLPKKIRSNTRGVSNQNIIQKQNFQNQQVLPKEIIQKGLFSTSERYIFFGYDTSIGKYRCVCYNRNPFSKIPVFRKLEDNGEISDELTLDQIKAIGNKKLLQLFCFLNKKSTDRGNGTQYMQRLQTYLTQYVKVKIPEQLYC